MGAVVWVGEMQLERRTRGVIVRNAVVRVRSTIRVGEMQLYERTGGVMVRNTTIQVRSMV